MSDLHSSLQALVGESATALLAKHLETIPDAPALPGTESRITDENDAFPHGSSSDATSK